jgi:predicted transcriptional regulator
MAVNLKKKGETSTTVSVGIRIDPKIKFALDLMGRMQKRSLTAVIEWAISNAIAQQQFRSPDETFADAIEKVWSTDESTRFVQQALYMPETLTYDELRIWETIKESIDFWAGNHDGTWTHVDFLLRKDEVREHWDRLLEHVQQYRTSPTIVPYSTIPF